MVDIGEKRGVLVECSREMYRRLALSAQENRRSLGNEAGALLEQVLTSTEETDVELVQSEQALARVMRKPWPIEGSAKERYMELIRQGIAGEINLLCFHSPSEPCDICILLAEVRSEEA